MHMNDVDMTDNEDSPIWVTEFDAQKAAEFCNALFRASAKDPAKPIVVYINSPGGEASGLLAMMSAMDTVPNKVITVAMGYAMSAGAVLLGHGGLRFASPHARIMLHKVQAMALGNLDDIVNETEELTNLNKYIFGVLAKDCKKSVAEIEKTLGGVKREVYLSSDEAKAYGLVDMVGVPQVQFAPVETSYQINVMGANPADAPKATKPPKSKKKAKK